MFTLCVWEASGAGEQSSPLMNANGQSDGGDLSQLCQPWAPGDQGEAPSPWKPFFVLRTAFPATRHLRTNLSAPLLWLYALRQLLTLPERGRQSV